jgi:hypothetical protein
MGFRKLEITPSAATDCVRLKARGPHVRILSFLALAQTKGNLPETHKPKGEAADERFEVRVIKRTRLYFDKSDPKALTLFFVTPERDVERADNAALERLEAMKERS